MLIIRDSVSPCSVSGDLRLLSSPMWQRWRFGWCSANFFHLNQGQPQMHRLNFCERSGDRLWKGSVSINSTRASSYQQVLIYSFFMRFIWLGGSGWSRWKQHAGTRINVIISDSSRLQPRKECVPEWTTCKQFRGGAFARGHYGALARSASWKSEWLSMALRCTHVPRILTAKCYLFHNTTELIKIE